MFKLRKVLTYFAILVCQLDSKLLNPILRSLRESNLKHLNEVLLLHLAIIRLVHHPVVVTLNNLGREWLSQINN